MKSEELMDMVRRSSSGFVSYDKAHLKEIDFFNEFNVVGKAYYSVIDFVDDYNSPKKEMCDKYFLINNEVLIHFTDEEEAMIKASDMFDERYPKHNYFISYADKKKFYRRVDNLKILLV